MKIKEKAQKVCLSEHSEFIDGIVINHPFLKRKAKKADAKVNMLLEDVDHPEWDQQYEEYLVIMTNLLLDSLNTDIGHPA